MVWIRPCVTGQTELRFTRCSAANHRSAHLGLGTAGPLRWTNVLGQENLRKPRAFQVFPTEKDPSPSPSISIHQPSSGTFVGIIFHPTQQSEALGECLLQTAAHHHILLQLHLEKTMGTCRTPQDPTGSAAVYHWKNYGENSEKRMQRMKLLKIRSYTDEPKLSEESQVISAWNVIEMDQMDSQKPRDQGISL